MDLQRTKILLDKINRLHQNLSASKTAISSIEKKLMLDYLSNMYDAVLDDTPAISKVAPVIVPKPVLPKPVPTPIVEKPTPIVENVTTPEPAKINVAPVPEPTMVFKKEKAPAPTPPPPKPEPPVVKEEKPQIVFEKPAPKPTPVAKPRFNDDYDELFSFEDSGELSDKLAGTKIKNIKSSMGINERYLTINELFDGKSTDLDTVLDKLESFTSFEQARGYLEQDILQKYDWINPDKVKKAKRFIKLVKSRY